MNTSIRVGINVRTALKASERSQSWLASKIGMDPSALSRRVRGYFPFDVEELASISEILAIPFGSLVEISEASELETV